MSIKYQLNNLRKKIMSNIDNFKPASDNNNNNNAVYQKRENFTQDVVELIEFYDEKLQSIVSEFDSIEEKRKHKECKAFKEKMAGLSAMKKFHDSQEFQDLLYWYVKQPRGEA